jgi:hypothetical protein
MIMGGKDGESVAGGGETVGVPADPGTKFVVQTTVSDLSTEVRIQ